jgi:hypothetical protein
VKRRVSRSAKAVAATFKKLRLPETRGPGASGLATCALCRLDFVSPVEFEPVDDDHWWMLLRCGECGTFREVTVENRTAERFDDELARGTYAIDREAHRLEHERMTVEADAFVAALEHDLIEPADFARWAA